MAKPKSKQPSPQTALTRGQGAALFPLAALFFLVVCLCSSSTIKVMAMLLLIGGLATVFLCFSSLRDRVTPPWIALTLVVVMDGVSTLYAASGKFALYEFLKVLAAFCCGLLLLAWTPGRGVQAGRRAASILEGCAALASLFSIDLLSTRLFSGPLLSLLGRVSSDYADLIPVEIGVRMNSLFENPNVFAGCAGIGVLLALGLAVSSPGRLERRVHLLCLFLNSLGFVLAFSMGATATILPAFLVLLALERKERRGGLLLLMAETLVLTIAAAVPISMTGLEAWKGVQPIPLLCALAGFAALCASDALLDRRLAPWLNGQGGRKALLLLAALLALFAAFAALAFHLSGPAGLQAGETLRRAAYPAPGAYALSADADGPVSVTVESQNQRDTMMHTSTILYEGPLSGGTFTVPEDSIVVYFNLRAQEDVRLDAVTYAGSGGTGALRLRYLLLPEHIANRLQGLFANQNAIQRLVFFADGLKLFQRSPVFGLGLGAFENGIRSVQSFDYETKYAHNHYIQTLAETGVVGLTLFVGLLAVSAAAVWKARRKPESHPLLPALGGALVFVAAHAAVEVVFSFYAYLPMAFGVFALISLCGGGALPLPGGRGTGNGVVLTTAALMAAFGVLLGCNMAARGKVARQPTFSDLTEAVKLDRFEWADYMLTYVTGAAEWYDSHPEIASQADAYADRLSRVDSNTIPLYLAEYYFRTGRPEQGFAQAERYVDYVASDPEAWEQVFALLARYEEDTPDYRAGVRRVAGKLLEWNEAHLGGIALDAETQAWLDALG